MDEFKTNICNALMKQSLTSTDNCLNHKRKLKLENYNEQKAFLFELVTSYGLPWRDGKRTQSDRLV